MFDEVREHIETTREDCKALTNSVYGVMHEIRSATTSEDSLLHHLAPLTAFRNLENSRVDNGPEWGWDRRYMPATS